MVNSPGGRHTHTDTNMHTDFLDKSIFKKPGVPAKGWYASGLINNELKKASNRSKK